MTITEMLANVSSGKTILNDDEMSDLAQAAILELNQRDAELAELRKSERDLQSKVFELLREREAIQAGVKGGATVPMETYLGKMTNEAGRK